MIKRKKILNFKNRFFNDHVYLLVISLIFLIVSLFTAGYHQYKTFSTSFTNTLQDFIKENEQSFKILSNDTALLNKIIKKTASLEEIKKLEKKQAYTFITENKSDYKKLSFWSTQMVIPDSTVFFTRDKSSLVKLANGYYFLQKKELPNALLISLLPIKWQYSIPNNILKNEFYIYPQQSKSIELTEAPQDEKVVTKDGKFLFSIIESGSKDTADLLTLWLRIFSIFPLLLFLHFASYHIYNRNGFIISIIFLVGILFFLRLITYSFPIPVNLRQFELFDPAIYASGNVLRSLGDLFINCILVFWVINFIKTNIYKVDTSSISYTEKKSWAMLSVGALLLLLASYSGNSVIRSMVSDSHISFDVLNFFSLNFFSVIGFLILCIIIITYYYFCRIILHFLIPVIAKKWWYFLLIIAVQGLLLLSFRIGSFNEEREVFILLWLLIFIFILIRDLMKLSLTNGIISKLIFWIFFFSVSIANIIVTENSKKELRNRKHYAEIIATKSESINDVLLNTMLTGFRPEILAEKFPNLSNPQIAQAFRDSILNSNIRSYNDKYDTKILLFDSAKNPIGNTDNTNYKTLYSILSSQTKPTSVDGLFYFDAGYETFNYIAQKIIKSSDGNLLGFLFIIINPRSVTTETLYPELFSRAHVNSIENSTEYAYAIYSKGRLVFNHNDYIFSYKYVNIDFAGQQFLLQDNKAHSELWFNAGGEKYIVIVKENKRVLELITLFSYLFCFFLLLAACYIVISSIVLARFNFKKMYGNFQLTIRQQVHGTIIFFSITSFIIIGAATILFFIERYQNSNKEMLGRTIKVMQQSLAITFTNAPKIISDQQPNVQNDSLNKIITDLSLIHGIDINFYNTAGSLISSSLPLPYTEGVVSTKMQPMAFYHLNNKDEIQYFQKEQIAELDFVSEYIPVKDKVGKLQGYLNIPYFTSQRKLKEEISNFLVTIINLNAFIFLIAGMVALIITNRITNSFSFISDKMKKINLTKTNEKIEWHKKDEIGALVKEYNKMLVKLDESAAVLARTERESAWQEMAKQVAHEIKNPLTPMKLSMQYLQKSIENNAPNIKELGAKVSATLVEQIDYLSHIAGEFSRFANIEKSNPEVFDVIKNLLSIKQLYEADTKATFDWSLPGGIINIYADKTHVNRILTNLILNGMQAVAEGVRPQIQVSVSLKDEHVVIKITDNGTGIDDEAKAKLFTPNFTTKSSGTGLGLAMSKRMVEQANGYIDYETSSLGTSFFVGFPIYKN